MSSIHDVREVRSLPWPLRRPAAAICARMRGPGGYYNAGNLLGFSVSLGLQLAAAPQGSVRTSTEILYGFVAGSPSALAFTMATVIFLVSGEVYHRAWRDDGNADAGLTRLADILSAVGGLALTISLIFLGQALLAVVSGLLIVLGKLGSAGFGDNARLPLWPAAWPDPFRSAVLAGRAPGIAAVGLDLAGRIGGVADGGALTSLIQPMVLIVCYLLWINADLLLVDGARVPRLAAGRA